MNKNEIAHEVAVISSGCLARIFRTNRYDEIDTRQGNWIAWIQEQSDAARWDSWIDCLEEYSGSCGILAAA